MNPYYHDEAAGITLYHGDCREILPMLPRVDLMLSDPPYGIGADVRQLARANKQHGHAATISRDYGISNWDGKPADVELVALIRSKGQRQIIWGGNYFHLPPAKCWLVWDKDNGGNGYADCELAWTNLDGAVRKYRHRWMGMLQENMEAKEDRVHPTQKPVRIMAWCLSFVPEGVVLDPFLGSGSTLVACRRFGRSGIGIEIEEKYCEIAAKRIERERLELFEPIPEQLQFALDLPL